MRKKQAAGRHTVGTAERGFCMECFRYIKRGQPTGRRVAKAKRDLALSHGYCRPCGEKVKAQMKAQALEIARLKKRKANASELDQAIDKSTEFHGRPPRRIRKVAVKWPRSLVHLGPCAQVNYVSDKWGDGWTEYFHKFTGRCDVFAAPTAQPDGDGLLILKGSFKLKPEGITG